MTLSPMTWWAVRDVRHRFVLSVLVFAAVAALTTLIAVVLVLSQAVSKTAHRLLDQTPDLVVRRIDAGGWRPLPEAAALAVVTAIPGIIEPRGRIWGSVGTHKGPVTIVGHRPRYPTAWADEWPRLRPGDARIGNGVSAGLPGGELTLTGRNAVTVRVLDRFPAQTDMATFDLVLLHPQPARTLLGLASGSVSDLAMDVYHDTEITPLAKILTNAFPWPVQVVTRPEVQTQMAARLQARSSAAILVMIPGGFALALLVIGISAWQRHPRTESGVLKAMGWTGSDLMRLTVTKAILIGIPALTVGLAAAYVLCFGTFGRWLCQLLFDWPGPALRLTAAGAALPLCLSAILIMVPYLITTFWSGWQLIRSDPLEAIQAGVP